MERRVERTYSIPQRDIHEAILAWLKAKDMPHPKYVGNTDSVKWEQQTNGIVLRWTEVDEI